MSRTIVRATREDADQILALYRTMLYGAAAWSEEYPNRETIQFDLSRNALFVMKNELGEILATISIDEDEAVEALPCWSKDIQPVSELSRLGVRSDVQNQGIARQMMQHVFEILKQEGKKGVHILVLKGHVVALASYTKLGFKQVGTCQLFDHKDFICLELAFEEKDNEK